ncbi:MAG: hypothetical protein Q8M83_04725 [bacterium]|nr:hypothetical protein [bacterium]
MKKYFFVLTFLAFFSVSVAVLAADAEIEYPVKELGNCANKAACQAFCDKSSNMEACLGFAERHNMMSTQEIQTARKFIKAGAGPGGCATKDSCETYCDSIEHLDECVTFAEKNGLMAPRELEEAKKVQAAKARGVKMPACGSKKKCDAYCSETSHMEECITFAQEAGFMSEQEISESKKVLTAIKAGAKPPPCRGKEQCDAYCSEEEHFDVCLDFALAAGFMDPKDEAMARKTKGKGPGGCRGKEQCDAFCQADENMETCAQFAFDNDMMTKEEFEMMKKTKGKGPGGCKSKDECENFCQDMVNQETCFNFAKDNGLIPEEDLRRMEQGKKQFKETMQSMPSEVYSCLESVVGAETMAKFKNGEAMPPQEIGDKMKNCFEKNMPQRPENMPPDGEGRGMAPGTTGPGGCANPEECQKYCENNPEQCQNFQTPPVQFAPGTGSDQERPGQYQPPSSGSGASLVPCEGDNCQPPPPQGRIEYRPPQVGERPMPCQGDDCPSRPPLPDSVNGPPPQFAPGTEENRPLLIERTEPIRPLEDQPLPPTVREGESFQGLTPPAQQTPPESSNSN